MNRWLGILLFLVTLVPSPVFAQTVGNNYFTLQQLKDSPSPGGEPLSAFEVALSGLSCEDSEAVYKGKVLAQDRCNGGYPRYSTSKVDDWNEPIWIRLKNGKTYEDVKSVRITGRYSLTAIGSHYRLEWTGKDFFWVPNPVEEGVKQIPHQVRVVLVNGGTLSVALTVLGSLLVVGLVKRFPHSFLR